MFAQQEQSRQKTTTYVVGLVIIMLIVVTFIVVWTSTDGFMSKNTSYLGCQSCGGYDITNMDEYSAMGSQSAAMSAPPCTLHDRIHESYAYDCYAKPDDFLRRLDRVYQPFHQDGVGVLRNIYAERLEGATSEKSEDKHSNTSSGDNHRGDNHRGGNRSIPAVDPLNPPNEYPPNPPMSQGYYSPLYNTVITDLQYGCFGASTQPTGSIPEGRLPLFYNHSIDSVSDISRDTRNQRWYGPHSGYLN